MTADEIRKLNEDFWSDIDSPTHRADSYADWMLGHIAETLGWIAELMAEEAERKRTVLKTGVSQ